MTSGDDFGEFEHFGALDERDTLIDWLERRIDAATRASHFCGVDIPGVTANLAMLATVIKFHGGRGLLLRSKVITWGQRIDQPFTSLDRWGDSPWPEKAKNEWRKECQRIIQKLLGLIDKH